VSAPLLRDWTRRNAGLEAAAGLNSRDSLRQSRGKVVYRVTGRVWPWIVAWNLAVAIAVWKSPLCRRKSYCLKPVAATIDSAEITKTSPNDSLLVDGFENECIAVIIIL
jgi:hypothetical protein